MNAKLPALTTHRPGDYIIERADFWAGWSELLWSGPAQPVLA